MHRHTRENKWPVHLTKNDVKVLREIISDGRATDTKIAKIIGISPQDEIIEDKYKLSYFLYKFQHF
jgi:hypothetical protein